MQSRVGILSRNWGALVARGVPAILFGLIPFLIRRVTMALLIAIFAAHAFVDRICALIAATRRQYGRPSWALLIGGLAGIATAGVALFMPGLATLTLVFVIAGWAIALGVLEVVAAVRVRRQIEGEWMSAVLIRRMTLAVLTALFAAYALFRDGIFALIAATRRQHGKPWWALALVGLAGIATAGVVLFMPGLATLTLVFGIVGWAIALGVLEMVATVRLRQQIEGEVILCFESGEAIETPLHAPSNAIEIPLPAPSERTELPVDTERTGRPARRRVRVRAVAERTHGKEARVERELAGVEGPLVAPAHRERPVA